jgi:8-oxo-dGTP diphosphatase
MEIGLMIPEFGIATPGVNYVLRPGGYAVILATPKTVAVVSTPAGLFLPGGGQNEGESPRDAAVRETAEECRLRIAVKQLIGVADELVLAAEEQIHFRKRCTFFLADVLGRSEASEPDHELLWLPLSEAKNRLLHGSQRWAVSEADLPHGEMRL